MVNQTSSSLYAMHNLSLQKKNSHLITNLHKINNSVFIPTEYD